MVEVPLLPTPLLPTPLPIAPEPLAALRARYPAALLRVWNADHIAAFISSGLEHDRPTLHREHIFDCEGGVRIGISAESGNSGAVRYETYIHASASLTEGGSYEREIARLAPPPCRDRAKRFLVIAERLIAEISGRFDFAFLGASGKGVFHWHAAMTEAAK